MKKLLYMILIGMLAGSLVSVVSAAGNSSEEERNNIIFSVREIANETEWKADGEWSDGEYSEIQWKKTWLSTAWNLDEEADQCKNLDFTLGMSWDYEYLYTYIEFEDPNGHNCEFDDDPHWIWQSGAVQLGMSDIYFAGDQRLEYGVAKSSVTGDLLSNVWADYLHSGYNAPSEDFIVTVDGDTIVYEIRTPFEAFSETDARAGAQYGYCMVISWGNGTNYAHTQLASGCTGDAGKAAQNFARIVLENTDGATVDNRGKVFKGTPKLDGVLDSIYLRSNVNTIKNDLVNYAWGGAAVQDFSDAASYFLWDENYLYVCTVNTDSTRVNLTGEKDWKNDAAEMWFIDEDLRYKIHAAADGNFFLGGDGDGETAFDFADAKSAAAYTEDGWCVEVALPLNNLKIGREFSYSLQVNNVINDDASAGSASGSQQADCPMVCVAYAATDNPEQLPESVAGKFGFTVQEAVTGWNPDGVKSAGEYYDIDYLPEWCVGVCHDISLAYAARALPVDVAMSWDDEYVYTWLSYPEETGHHFTAAEHPSFWDGEIVQLGFAEIDATYLDLTNRLETGYGMYSDSRERTTINWADGRGTGYAANNSAVEDFACFVNGKTVTYEIRVPFDAFTAKSPAAGVQFKFCPVICFDGGHGEYQMWSLGDGITGGPKDPSLHANVTLAAAPGADAENGSGDINGDGTADEKDLAILKKYYAGYAVKIPNPLAADFNNDKKLTRADVMIFSRRLADWNR